MDKLLKKYEKAISVFLCCDKNSETKNGRKNLWFVIVSKANDELPDFMNISGCTVVDTVACSEVHDFLLQDKKLFIFFHIHPLWP